MNSINKYSSFFPRKVYRCPPCLLNPIKKISNAGRKYNLTEIICFVQAFNYKISLLSDKIFCTKVGDCKEDCLIICKQHLIVVLLALKKFRCMTDSEDDFKISEAKESFCSGCIRTYMRRMTSYFYFNNIN